MALNNKSILTGALIAGLLSGTAALATEEAQDGGHDAHQAASKDGCEGKAAKDKNSCKGHAKKKGAGKNSCSGKDGCGQK